MGVSGSLIVCAQDRQL